MTVVEAYACGKKTDPPDNKSLFPPRMISLLIEGIAQNTTGSVFVPEVIYNRVMDWLMVAYTFRERLILMTSLDR